MHFFDRKNELDSLQDIHRQSLSNAQFTVVTGRRRVGKTSLILKACENQPTLYFFVARKVEKELCESYQKEIATKLGIPTLGQTEHFAEIFEYLMKLSAKMPFTLFIDEFQDFLRVNKSVYSDMQRIWDLHHQDSRINLIVCGSIYSMMSKIFKDKKEPLYNRQTRFMAVKPFAPSVLKEILAEYNPTYTHEDLLALYSFTGGVAKYIQLLADTGGTTKERMLNRIVSPDSVFIGEGKSILIEEFGKDYGGYFSILSAIARGKNSRSEIENAVGKEIGGYLSKLENDYGVISKNQPLFEKTQSKNVHYLIDDNFLNFWFRFIYKYNYMVEIGAFDNLKKIITRDYETFSGIMLERYFRHCLIESQAYTRIGNWRNRKGENEIDIVAENEIENKAVFFEVKRKPENIDMERLRWKAETFLRATGKFAGYSIEYKGLSMENM